MCSLQFPAISQKKVSEIAYEILKEKITSKALLPGQRLDLDDIELQLGISRTPLKEALALLETEGLVKILPRSGTFITNPSKEDIQASFEVRRVLEIHAVELATLRASPEEIASLLAAVNELKSLADSPDIDSNYAEYVTRDHLLHKQIALLTDNPRLSQAIERENLHMHMARVRYPRAEKELGLAQNEHEQIVAAIAARNVKLAKDLMDAHLQRARISLLHDMEDNA
jgi:GntR family transcriptional regulator, rspAB operon transcriptional repressor